MYIMPKTILVLGRENIFRFSSIYYKLNCSKIYGSFNLLLSSSFSLTGNDRL